MCYSKAEGGQRCYPHAKTKYDNAVKKFANGGPEDALIEAETELASTLHGYTELRRVADRERDPAVRARLEASLLAGGELKRKAAAVRRAVRAATAEKRSHARTVRVPAPANARAFNDALADLNKRSGMDQIDSYDEIDEIDAMIGVRNRERLYAYCDPGTGEGMFVEGLWQSVEPITQTHPDMSMENVLGWMDVEWSIYAAEAIAEADFDRDPATGNVNGWTYEHLEELRREDPVNGWLWVASGYTPAEKRTLHAGPANLRALAALRHALPEPCPAAAATARTR